MSVPATFADIFKQVCVKGTPANDVFVGRGPANTLVACGSDENRLMFTPIGVEFRNKAGQPAKYSWDELDFILPGDLSLASDKIYSFCDMDTAATRTARKAGYVAAFAAAAYFAYLVWGIFYELVIQPVIWLHVHLGTFGDIVALSAIVCVVMAVGPALLAIAAGLLATGGAISVFANWVGRQFQPLIKFIFSKSYGEFQNGLHIVGEDWVKMPWGSPTTRALDLVFIGVKLRRRGLT